MAFQTQKELRSGKDRSSLLRYNRPRSEPGIRLEAALCTHTQGLWCLGHAHFHLARILPIARSTVTLGPLIEALLGRGDIGRVTTPGFKNWPLQSAPIRKAQGPRVLTHGIHGIEVFCSLFGALATG